MAEFPDDPMRAHVAARGKLLREISESTPTEALKRWPPDTKDWGALAAFALKPALPPKLYQSLFERGNWFLQATLCANPNLPLDLLYTMAELRRDEALPSASYDLQNDDYDPGAIKYIARATLRRRFRA